jgi:hypothetical protein
MPESPSGVDSDAAGEQAAGSLCEQWNKADGCRTHIQDIRRELGRLLAADTWRFHLIGVRHVKCQSHAIERACWSKQLSVAELSGRVPDYRAIVSA